MLVQEHAESLLAAWLAGDATALEKQLSLVLADETIKPDSRMEHEERELLKSISTDLRSALITRDSASAARAQTAFQLLFHLAQRTTPQFSGACAA